MSTPRFILTDAAETDLRTIIRYTRKQWGDAQARVYVAKLEKGIAHAVIHPDAMPDMSDLYPALRVAHCEHHSVFFLPRESEPALIVAIFHERMDLMSRVARRLGKAG